jgi:hypothetical protein
VIVNRVDGENLQNNRAVVAPGKRQVTIDLPPRKGFRATQHTFEVATEPCWRYYVAAPPHLPDTAGLGAGGALFRADGRLPQEIQHP